MSHKHLFNKKGPDGPLLVELESDMKFFKSLLLIIIVLFGVSFAYLNSDQVVINYYVGSVKLPLALLMIVPLIIGGLLGLLIGTFKYLKLKNNFSRQKSKLMACEKELQELRLSDIADKSILEVDSR